MITDYESCVKYIDNIPLFSHEKNERNKSGNENLSFLMEELGNPHKSIKSIHIAGTNGKGSTASFIKCILNKMGYKTGIFTSPHLIDIRERIAIDGDLISKTDFVSAFCTVYKAEQMIVENGKSKLSYFEFLFAMAAVYYDIKKPDYVIYETGLGGRLDATNLLSPVITVITSIGLDHMKYLGDTIEKIAAEKAGIIKEGVPVVYKTESQKADAVISKVAKNRRAEEINVAKTDYLIFDITDKTIDFALANDYYIYERLVLKKTALYQVDNAVLAIVACNVLLKDKGVIKEDIIKQALLDFYWPGRMESLYPNVIIDGAHNEDAIDMFNETVHDLYRDKKIEILFAVCEDKDYEPMIKKLCDGISISKVYVTKVDSYRTASPDHVAELFRNRLDRNTSTDIMVDCDIKKIFKTALSEVLNKDDTMLFCVGSLYLVGSIKQIVLEAKDD